jgi:hypothetical protein
MQSKIIFLGAWIRGSMTICDRRLPYKLPSNGFKRTLCLSSSIATYRPKASFFEGVPDGKSSVV